MLSDNHMHTRFSGDSEADPQEMIKSAKEKGLSGLTFTDHLDWDYPTEPHLFDLDIEKYVKELTTLSATISDESFRVRVGIELGLQAHLKEKHAALLEQYDFDVVIGSVHQVDGADPYYDSFFEGKEIRAAYAEYFDAILENLAAFTDIDTLGHLDYISRYGMRYAKEHHANGSLRPKDFAGQINAIFDILLTHDIALEVNTGAFRYGYNEPNPSYEILTHYYNRGGRAITLGADAHAPEDVAIGFDKVIPTLKRIGFEGYKEFTHRNGNYIPF